MVSAFIIRGASSSPKRSLAAASIGVASDSSAASDIAAEVPKWRRGHLRTTLSEEVINPWDRPAGDRRSNDAGEGMRTRRPCVSDHAREGRQPIEIAQRAARALRVGGTPRVV